MANLEHLKILKQGVEVWNTWRKEHSGEVFDLSNANLSGMILHRAHLNGIDFTSADLSGANLDSADLFGAQLPDANLCNANLLYANLSHANLCNARLVHARLSGAKIINVGLNDADLSNANLDGANFIRAKLKNTKLGLAKIELTTFDSLDLRNVIGLETIIHGGPSTIGIDTLYLSQGQIPDKFLVDAGVPEEIIDIARAIRAGPAIQWHSCFISYSTKDDEFARRLHSRMREANMRVWFAPEDLKGGKKLHEQLFEAIQIHDRLLIVLSEHSIQSEWVMTEIRKAREVEKKEKRRKLFPIRLTDFETLRDWTCFDADTGKDLAVEVREYFIPDFSNWKVLADGHPAAFESAFARLKKDLEAENSKKP
jgi:hypothetical protein